MPKDQTLEGGAQIRLTPSGLNKLTSIVPALLNSSLNGGVCVPQGKIGGCSQNYWDFNSGVCYCSQTNAACGGSGCTANVTLNSVNVTVKNSNTLTVALSASVNTSVQLTGALTGIGGLGSCTLSVSSNNLHANADIVLGIKPTDGELELHLNQINDFGLNLSFSGCGILSDIAGFVSDAVDAISSSFLGSFIFDLLQPTLDNLVQNILPNPLGIAGMMDMGNVLEGVSPGTEALMEARVVPGGYASLANQGLNLGVITGINADEDPTTRTGVRPDGVAFASEPALCVPPIAAPNFGAPPANLPLTSRSTYRLDAADAFVGLPDVPNTDIAMGISETFLDLAGHHLVTSGAMCMGVGTSLIEQLNVGTIGILVPSLAELTSDTGKDPLLLVTRPQKAIDFAIGDNTAGSPAITIGLHNLEVDFYAFIYERYVRAFTLDLTMNIGINLEVDQQPGQPAYLTPTLSGISASEVTVKVLNSQFVAETPQHLEMVLPSVFNLVTPLLGNLPPIQVPSFAGFSLNNPRISKVTTSQDEFLALYATIGASQLMRTIGDQDAWTRARVAQMDAQIATTAKPANGTATLRSVTTPEPAQVRASLLKQDGGAMPEVVFDVQRFDDQGRELEWQYRLNDGMWHPYSNDTLGGFTVRDEAFAWQGKYHIGLRSRVKDDIHTASTETVFPVIIDSVGPKIGANKIQWDGDTMQVPLWDIVSEHTVAYAFGKPGADEPATAWKTGGMAELTRSEIDQLVVDRELVVFAKDEAGNQTIALIAPFHGQPSGEGCACQTSGGPSSGGIALVAIVGFVLVGRRGRGRRLMALARATRWGRVVATVGLWLGASTVMSLQPGCDCGDPASKACELGADCGPDFCMKGSLPFCIDGECVCSDDIPAGRIGPYSDVGTGADGSIWVSAYAQTYGDLVVAKVEPGKVPVETWEWVDGVPDGPVIVPDSKIRRGIDAHGDDVGMYTSIAVNAAGVPMVSYFDRDTGSLKFAAKVGDTWQKHTVQTGTGMSLGELGELTGMYSSITLRSDDGRPGIAYLAHVRDAQGARAEVRFAASQVPVPTSAADWQFWTVDTAPLPADDPQNPNIYPLPEGLGLFVDSARMPDQSPVVVYYDRGNGELKMTKFNPTSGMFNAPVVLDGSADDAGWSPSVAVSSTGVVHVAYVGATKDDLKYITDAANAKPEVVDDGYRIVGTTVDGLPKPEFHFVGDDASLVLAGGTAPFIAYQDSTTQELLLAIKGQDGKWTHTSLAGATDPWPGAYGFFAASGLRGTDLVISTWVIDQPSTDPFDTNWVEVFTRPTTIQ